MPRSANAVFISAPSARPSQVSSSHGSRIVTISAVAPDATNASNSSPVGHAEQRLDRDETGLGAARFRPRAMLGEDQVAEDDVRDAVARRAPRARP